MEEALGFLLTTAVLIVIIVAVSSSWGSDMDEYIKKLEEEDEDKDS